MSKKECSSCGGKRSLGMIFEPKSIAVIGASDDPNKVGFAVMNNIIKTFKGEKYPINIKRDKILGLKCYKSVMDIPGEVDCAVICIPARFVVATMEQLGKKGVKGVIIITAGFKEMGGEGIVLENKLKEVADKYKIRVVGPNCLGIISRTVNASFASRQPNLGNVAMISQSGAMMTAILDWAVEQTIGFSNFVSIGNKADLDEVDLINDFGEDDESKIVVCYVESITNGKKLLQTIPKVTNKKPVIVLKSGVTEQGRRAASSHTGALAQLDTCLDAAFDRVGITRAEKMTHLFDLALCFSQGKMPKGNKFAIVTNAGGPSIVATDSMVKQGVEMVDLRKYPEVLEQLKKVLPAEAALDNPVDIIGDATPKRYKDTLDVVLKMKDEECAGALVLVTPQSQTNPTKVAEIIKEACETYKDKLIVACFMGGVSMHGAKDIFNKYQIPHYEFPEQAITAMKYLVDYSDKRRKRIEREKEETFKLDLKKEQIETIKKIFENANKEGRKVLNSAETTEICNIYGIKCPQTRIVSEESKLDEIGDIMLKNGPVVMKIVSVDILHKSDCGGVVVGIKTKEELKEEYKKMMVNVKKAKPKAKIAGVEIQEMIDIKKQKKVTEMIVGVVRDATFGPVVMVGKGGTYANFIKDVKFDLLYDFKRSDAQNLLKKTQIYKILEGVRGEPRSAIEGIEETVLRIGALVNTFGAISELDVNPLLVFDEKAGVNAVDIKITFDPKAL